MEENHLDVLKENLERRFSILIKATNHSALLDSKMDYLNYLYSEKIAGKVIENLLKKLRLNKYHKDLISVGYFDYFIGKITRQTKIKTLGVDNFKKTFDISKPPFYTDYIDSELHLEEISLSMIRSMFDLERKPINFEKLSRMKPEELLEDMKKHSGVKSFLGEVKEKSKQTPRLIEYSDTEINNFSSFHFLLIEEISILSREQGKAKHKGSEDDNSFWLTKNSQGEYLFDGSYVDIKSKKGHYVMIFDTVFSLKPEGGEISYDDIIASCSERKLRANSRSIQRALSGPKANLFRYVKGIRRIPSHGVPIFRAQQAGKYLEFNNKKINRK